MSTETSGLRLPSRGLGIIAVVCLVVVLLAGTALGAYAAAGGGFGGGAETSIELRPIGDWSFGTMVGCGPRGSRSTTCIGPVAVVHFSRLRE